VVKPLTKGSETRRRILDAAVDQFGLHGFRHTSVSAIAREIGLTAPAIHAHFATKNELFDAALAHDAASLTVMVERLFDGRPGALGWAEAIPELVEAARRQPLVRRVLENQEPGMLARLADVPMMANLRKRIASQIDLGQQVGLIRTDLTAATLSAGVEAILMSLLLAAVQTGVVETEPERAAGIVGVIVGGLLSRSTG